MDFRHEFPHVFLVHLSNYYLYEDKIQRALGGLHNQCATGVDRVPGELLKYSTDANANELIPLQMS